MFDVEFNGRAGKEYHIIPVRRPSIPAPEERIEEVEVPGRNGVLTISEGLYESVVIPVEFNFMAPPDKWMGVYRNAKRWLSGGGKLKFSDDPECFYKALFCKITTTERTSRKIGNLTAEFTCDPYTYMINGEKEIVVSGSVYNPGAVAAPVYRITGEGLCTLTVNGYEFAANVGQEVVIDSDLQIAYKNDGSNANTDVTGDYARLWLQPGENAITATAGFSVNLTPRWREL